jgi:uncharacterized protein (DUF2147 family)
MSMKMKLSTILLSAALLSLPVQAIARTPLDGQWRNPKGSVTVRVAGCGDAICGYVVQATAKAKAGARKGGTPNLIGTQILRGLRPAGNGVYKGVAFDPKRNLHAPATIRLLDSSTLSVKGCLINGILCKEQRWTRVG